MAGRQQPSAEVMGSHAGLHSDQASRLVGQSRFDLPARALLAQNDVAARIKTDEVERRLAEVDPDRGDGGARRSRS
jgi:hypothetical protein